MDIEQAKFRLLEVTKLQIQAADKLLKKYDPHGLRKAFAEHLTECAKELNEIRKLLS